MAFTQEDAIAYYNPMIQNAAASATPSPDSTPHVASDVSARIALTQPTAQTGVPKRKASLQS